MRFFIILMLVILFNGNVSAQYWTNVGNGLNFRVYDLEVHNNNLHAAGMFWISSPSIHTAHWNDTTWNATGTGMNNPVVELMDYNGILYAGGAFDSIHGNPAGFMAAYSGTDWYAANNADAPVEAFCIHNGDLYAAGSFTAMDGIPVNRILNLTSGQQLADGLSDYVNIMFSYNGDLYAGGGFSGSGIAYIPYIARWNGSVWDSLGSGTNGVVHAFAEFQGDLYVGGDFTTAGGLSANYIARWDGTTWSAAGTGMDDIVYTLQVYNGNLYAGGSFTTADGNLVNRIAKWDGSSWSVVGNSGGMNDKILDLEVYKGELYAAGDFTMADGMNCKYVAKFVNTVSLNELSTPDITLYPNPVSSKINLDLKDKSLSNCNYRIIDAQGKTVNSGAIDHPSGFISIDAEILNPGIYFLELKSEINPTCYFRFIKM